MTMRLLRRRTWMLWIAGTVCAAGALVLAYGPLVPWSPVHPGYREVMLTRARVLYPADRPLPDAYRHVDEWIGHGESFLALRAPTRITIVLCRNWSDFERFAPWIRGRAVAGLTLATGDAIYITPKVDEKHLDHGEFVRHEIAHAILSQNTSTLRAYVGPHRDPWLHEGLAVWFARQRAYISQPEFFERAPAFGVATSIRDGYGSRDLQFTYIAWRDFLDYVDQTYGHDRFVAFVHDANRTPDRIDALFRSFFAVSWAEDVARFERAVLTRTFTPRDPQ